MHDGRAGLPGRDGHHGLARLAGRLPVGRGSRSRGRRVRHEVAQRVGDAVEHAGVELDVLRRGSRASRPCPWPSPPRAPARGSRRRPGAPGPSPGPWRRRGPGPAALRRPRCARAARGWRPCSRSPSDTSEVAVSVRSLSRPDPACSSTCRSRRTSSCCSATSSPHRRRGPVDPAHVELGLADDVEQVVHPTRRHADLLAGAVRPGGRDRVAGIGDVGLVPLGLDVRRARRRPGQQPGDRHRVGTGQRGVESGGDLGQRRLGQLSLGTGQRPPDRLGGHEQDVDEVPAYVQPSVAQLPEQVLAAVRERRRRASSPSMRARPLTVWASRNSDATS